MPTKTSYKQGELSWIELCTTDANAAKRFYGGLFGWTFDDRPAGPGMTYTMCKLGEHYVGALYEKGPDMAAVPTHWATYVTVDDVDATTKKAASAGGKVLKDAFDVMDVGRMSVVADPTGAVLCLWQAKEHIGAGVRNEPGALCWGEVFTTDIDAAGKFYATTLGWQAEAVDMGPMGTYTLFKVPGEKTNAAGMMPMPSQMQGVPPHWLAYIEVVDCDASAKKATDLGGTIVTPPMDIPNIGRFSIIQDPTGAVFALYKNEH